MGEIMDEGYNAAYRATAVAAEGARKAQEAVEPRLAAAEQECAELKKRIEAIEWLVGLKK